MMRTADPRKRFMEGCRTAIMAQKRDLRAATGKEGEIHHMGKTFAELVTEFIIKEGYDIETVVTRKIHHGFEFVDVTISWKFAVFHQDHAQMVILTPDEHKAIHDGAH